MPRRAALTWAALWPALWPGPARADERRIELMLRLEDHERRPIAAERLRLVLGTQGDWRAPGAGTLLTTDGEGHARWSGSVAREQRTKRWVGSFADSLLSLPQRVDWLQVGVELPFLGAPCLYTTELDWFANRATSVQSTPGAWWADAQGRYTRGAEWVESARAWRLPLAAAQGLVSTTLGHEFAQASLMPADDAPPRWRVQLLVRRAAAPVRR
jgi:hypothetical protein